jgi:riboflavin kinase/FMN adenylyltransferase
MRTWRSILQARQELNKTKKTTVVTIGNFDGVHRGHQNIMRRIVELARQTESISAVITFDSHSESLLGEQPLLLNTPQIRREFLAGQGIDCLLEIKFDRNFAGLEPELFFRTWLVEGLHAKSVVVGYDFRFGAERRGDFMLLQRLGLEAQVMIERVTPVYDGKEIISSSKIRQLLAEGRVERANQMLGYAFVIEGEVVGGEQRGRKLGFPTANIHLAPEYLLPCYGVYLVRMTVAQKDYFGLANVGIKPTFGRFMPLVEVYLFDLEINLYGRSARVEFLKFIRPENRFSGPEALKTQIQKDIEAAKSYLGFFEGA